jgi:hypothetical protein
MSLPSRNGGAGSPILNSPTKSGGSLVFAYKGRIFRSLSNILSLVDLIPFLFFSFHLVSVLFENLPRHRSLEIADTSDELSVTVQATFTFRGYILKMHSQYLSLVVFSACVLPGKLSRLSHSSLYKG